MVVLRGAAGVLKLLVLCVAAGVLVAAIAFPAVGGIGLLSNQVTDAVDQVSKDMVKVDPQLMTTITDRNNQPIAYLYDQERVLVPSEEISPWMKLALVAIEDHRFYEHNGVDSTGTLRALIKTTMGKRAEGGSTITQQYVKNYLAYVVAKNDVERQKATEATPARKLKEARIALELETQLKAAYAGQPDGARKAKDEILTRYLNVVPFGGTIYGISTAANAWFGKSAKDLNEVESAFLAGLVNAPGALNPEKNPDKVKERRDLVLDNMAKWGALDPNIEAGKEKAKALKEKPIGTTGTKRHPNGCVTPTNEVNGFFCAYVISYLGKLGFSDEMLKRGGYTIKTTLDQEANKAAKRAAENNVSKTHEGIANVMAVVEPGGNKHPVRALVANRDFGNERDKGQSGFRLPTDVAKFGAGSIFKIFTAASALEQHKTGVYRSLTVPASYTSPIYGPKTDRYKVDNGWRDTADRQMTVQDTLAQSPNTIFVKMEEEAGLNNVLDMSVRLGLRESMLGVNRRGTKIDPKAEQKNDRISQLQWFKDNNAGAFTLGVSTVSVVELSNVGATLQSGGTWCPPSPIEQVVDRSGKPVDIKEQACERVIEPGLANSMVQALSQDIHSGTARDAANGANWDKNGRPMLGKTGTTNDHQSAGFVGATPNFSGAVLTFSDSPSPKPICDTDPPSFCKSGNIYGGKIPARTWFEAMKPIHNGTEMRQLPPMDESYAN